MTADTASVWNGFSAGLRRFIRKRVANEADAEDVLQDVFTRIHSGLRAVRDAGRLESWVYQVTRNAIADHLRIRRAGSLPEELAEEREPDRVPALVASWLTPLMEGLPDPDRDALQSTVRGVPQKELAARWGLSESAARSRVQRARRRLKELLLECCHIDRDRRGNAISYQRRAKSCSDCSCD